MSKKKHELSEDEAWEIAVSDHPEFRRALANNTLPDEIVDDDGNVANPRLHLVMHALVERQLASGDPPATKAAAEDLAGRGVSDHEIRHAIGRALSDEIDHMLKEKRVFDEARFSRQLREIVASYE